MRNDKSTYNVVQNPRTRRANAGDPRYEGWANGRRDSCPKIGGGRLVKPISEDWEYRWEFGIWRSC